MEKKQYIREIYRYALDYANYKNKKLRMIINKEEEETVFVFE